MFNKNLRYLKQAGKNYMLREFTARESKMSDLQNVPPAIYTDPNEIAQYLPLKFTECEKLTFPEREPESESSSTQQ